MLQISAIPAFDDNYIWLLHREGYIGCAVVDPGDEDPVIERLEEEGLSLDAILITHKHGDHVGGIRGLKSVWEDVIVYGPKDEPIQHVDVGLGEGDHVQLAGLEAYFNVMDVPGHTEGHIAYYGHDALFCGDTLFAGGCGRVFSGTHAQLSHSLQRIAELPGDTLAYCAHEYTLANLGFAKWVEPNNQAILDREKVDDDKRHHSIPTVPSSIAMELATNPFMRTNQPSVQAAVEKWAGRNLRKRDDVFHALRDWKDRDYD